MHHPFRSLLVILAAATSLGMLAQPVLAAAPSGSVAAVWVPKQARFVYQGFTTHYSCDGLRDTVKQALLQLGARKSDLQVREYGCTASAGAIAPFPGVTVKMHVLQPVRTAPADADKSHPLQAHWQKVDLKLDRTPLAQAGQCELIEQISQHLLPLFATRNLDVKTSCVPHQVTLGSAHLRAELLMPTAGGGHAAGSH